MSKIKYLICICCLLALTGCLKTSESGEETVTAPTSDASIVSDAAETVVTEPVWQPSSEDQEIAMWLKNYMTNSEYFEDLDNYRYYARAIGKDKDYFLKPEMWEVFYNEDIINRNRDINGLDIYLVRLNPYKLLETYAENNSCTVDELCKQLSVSKEQLYYNWGYNPASVDYYENHKNNNVSYSVEEQQIFGIYNNEARDAVMSTHMIVYDHNKGTVPYYSKLYDSMYIARRDNLKAYSKGNLYSEFTDEERNPAYKVNGIGIRAIIPLSLPNAFLYAENADKNVSVMINNSPFAYGCKDEDKLDLEAIYNYIDNHA